MELGGVPENDQLSEHKLWKGIIGESKARLQLGNTSIKKALPPTVAIMISLELFAVNFKGPLYLRAMAWLRLVRIWSGLRSKDSQGIAVDRLTLSGRGLRGILVETKTTGPGRRTMEVPCFVHEEATLANVSWLQVGFKMWRSAEFNYEQDYFIP